MEQLLKEVILPIVLPIASGFVGFTASWYANRSNAKREVNMKYLNPLRLQLEEVYARLDGIRSRAVASGGAVADLAPIGEAKNARGLETPWFVGEGCYLMSTCYLTACLFHRLHQLRAEVPYLRIGRGEDTKLLALAFGVQQSYLKDLGIYYVVQSGIGVDMWLETAGRLVTYREFCGLVADTTSGPWFDRLVDFHLWVGHGGKTGQVAEIMDAIGALSSFLDGKIGHGRSLRQRMLMEGGVA